MHFDHKRNKSILRVLKTPDIFVTNQHLHNRWRQRVSRTDRPRQYQAAGNGNTGRQLQRYRDCNVETGKATKFKSLTALLLLLLLLLFLFISV